MWSKKEEEEKITQTYQQKFPSTTLLPGTLLFLLSRILFRFFLMQNDYCYIFSSHKSFQEGFLFLLLAENRGVL